MHARLSGAGSGRQAAGGIPASASSLTSRAPQCLAPLPQHCTTANASTSGRSGALSRSCSLSSSRQQQQQQGRCQQRWRQFMLHARLLAQPSALRRAAAAAAQAGGGSPSGGDETDPETEAFLREFFEGMGAAGVPDPGAEEMEEPEEIGEAEYSMNLLKMGTWRLAGKVCPPIEALVAQVEDGWRTILPDLGLYPLERQWKYLDSLDPGNTVPLAYMSLQDPGKGEQGYPRLQLENRAYRSRAFRKLHIEVAVRQDGLQVFHCVMYPRLEYDLPILSIDVVASAQTGSVSLAVADPCPVSRDLRLPSFYEQPIRELQERYGVANSRAIPDWGKTIFSPLCIIMRPQTGEELAAFLKYTIALARYHTRVGQVINPIGPQGRERRVSEINAAHERYSAMMLRNDKTRRVLEKSFSPAMADLYLSQVMFDVEPLPAGMRPGGSTTASSNGAGTGGAGSNGSSVSGNGVH